MKKRSDILDTWAGLVDKHQTLDRVWHFLEGNLPRCIFAANPEKNFSVPKDPELYDAFKNADLLILDSIGMVWVARLLHGATLSRVPGVEFMKDDICRLAVQEDKSVFLFGAREAVNQSAAHNIVENHQNVPGYWRYAGCHCRYRETCA